MEIEGATPEDAGTYSVMAVNDLGDAITEADVTVEREWKRLRERGGVGWFVLVNYK